jgi:hypothetical protein
VSAPNELKSLSVKLSRKGFQIGSPATDIKLKVEELLDRQTTLAHRRERSVMQFEKLLHSIQVV